MSKTVFISLLAASCALAVAAPQNAPEIFTDGPGVTVSLNGATVMHRTRVFYPPAALKSAVQGTVSVQVKLDSTGEVSDAQVLAGPDELRRTALESVLQWHFTHDLAGATRVVQIAFEPPKPEAGQPETLRQGIFVSAMPAAQGRIQSIRVAGLTEQATAELLATLPVHEGDEWNAETSQKAAEAVRAFDEHLAIRQAGMVQRPSGATEVNLVIAAPGAPLAALMAPAVGRVSIAADAQSALIVTKVPPVYPPLAKAARVSGVVHLAAIIAKDGTVRELHSLGGPALLIQAAMDAVRQWVYQPSPVEVETTIDINFTLNE